jgi:hypothetical protein
VILLWHSASGHLYGAWMDGRALARPQTLYLMALCMRGCGVWCVPVASGGHITVIRPSADRLPYPLSSQ